MKTIYHFRLDSSSIYTNTWNPVRITYNLSGTLWEKISGFIGRVECEHKILNVLANTMDIMVVEFYIRLNKKNAGRVRKFGHFFAVYLVVHFNNYTFDNEVLVT